MSSRRLPLSAFDKFFSIRVTNGSLGLLLGVRSHLHTNIESRLSMHYHCDDLGDLPNDNVDNIDNKIDVNVDSNVANLGFADPALVERHRNFNGHLKNRHQLKSNNLKSRRHLKHRHQESWNLKKASQNRRLGTTQKELGRECRSVGKVPVQASRSCSDHSFHEESVQDRHE